MLIKALEYMFFGLLAAIIMSMIVWLCVSIKELIELKSKIKQRELNKRNIRKT